MVVPKHAAFRFPIHARRQDGQRTAVFRGDTVLKDKSREGELRIPIRLDQRVGLADIRAGQGERMLPVRLKRQVGTASQLKDRPVAAAGQGHVGVFRHDCHRK